MKRSENSITAWFTTLFKVWRREFYMVSHDVGVMLFFFFLTLMYPVIYTLIYNPETVRDIPVAIVDKSRTPSSRDLARMVDATDAMAIYDYAPSLADARKLHAEHKVYGILEIPEDYDKKLGRRQQAVVTFYSDMGLLLRYRAFVGALTDVQLAVGSEIRQAEINAIGLPAQSLGSSPVKSEAVMLGDPTQGFASFIIPGILVLIIQQSLILGVSMLAAGSSERRRRNGGRDPMAVDAGPAATILGKVLCYICIYLPVCIYVLHIVPVMFSLPHIGHLGDYLMFIIPMLLAASFLAITISIFVTERESSMLVVVFTSVVFLFLSGLTWPRYAMNGFWQLLGDCIPATWGVEGFIRMNSNGSLLAQESHPYMMLWLLAAVYFITAYLTTRYLYPERRRLSPKHKAFKA